MTRQKKLHLPDCGILVPPNGVCDCGRPPHPLPPTKKLIRSKGRLKVVARTARGKDLNIPMRMK